MRFFLLGEYVVEDAHCLAGLAIAVYHHGVEVDQVCANGRLHLACKTQAEISLQGVADRVKHKSGFFGNIHCCDRIGHDQRSFWLFSANVTPIAKPDRKQPVFVHSAFQIVKILDQMWRAKRDHVGLAAVYVCAVWVISDAGTPGISDPGFLLVRTCVQEGIEVQTLPGATAFVPALVSSGYPCDRFCFEGFLPQKKGRQTRLTELSEETRTMIFYESPYRLVKTLEQFAEFFGAERECSVAREISKKFEEHKRGTLTEVAAWYREHEPKGEIVIIVAGAPEKKKEKKSYKEA